MIRWECSYCGGLRNIETYICEGCSHVRTIEDQVYAVRDWGRVEMGRSSKPTVASSTATTAWETGTIGTGGWSARPSRRDNMPTFLHMDAQGLIKVVA